MSISVVNMGSGGGGKVLNGLVEEFLSATDTIDANTFVEFVSNQNALAYSTMTAGSTTYKASASIFNDTKAICVCDDSNGCTLTQVIEFNANSITVGTSVVISDAYAGNSVVGCISDSKAIIAGGAYVYLVSVSGLTITIQSSANTGATSITGIDVISANLAVIAYDSAGSSHYPYKVFININGSTISAGNSVSHGNGKYGGYSYQRTIKNNDRIYMFYSDDSTHHLCGKYFMSDQTPPSVMYQGEITTERVCENKYDIVALNNSTNYMVLVYRIESNVYAAVLNGNSTIGKGTSVLIDQHEYNAVKIKEISDTKFEVITIGKNEVRRTTFGINGLMVTRGKTLTLYKRSSGFPAYDVDYMGENIFFADLYPRTCYVIPGTLLVKPSLLYIDGLTKTKCTTIAKGEVWTV